MYKVVLWAGGVSFAAALLIGPAVISLMNRLRFGQYVRDDGPATHLVKAGTPTMGGVIFIFSLALASILFAGDSVNAMTALLITVGCGLVGFVDDFLKVVLKRPLGLKARYKLGGQLLLSVFLAVAAVYLLDRGTIVRIPFTGAAVDFGKLYIPFVVLVLVSSTNAVNLTDGLDGLAAGITVFVSAAYVFITLFFQQLDMAVFAAALLGGCLGFLVFNLHPARIFMGDTGSLALGGAIASLAIITATELSFIIIGGVFVIETLSVILQVLSFRFRGSRLFRMAPLHHHFELTGWSEGKVVYFFWAAGAVFALLGMFEVCKLG